MDFIYEWQLSWDRVVIRPEDLRSLHHQLRAEVDSAGEGEREEYFIWQEPLRASGQDTIDDLIIELRARHAVMTSIEMKVSRTTEQLPLAKVLKLPRKRTLEPGAEFPYVEMSGAPAATHLKMGAQSPAVQLEVLAPGPMFGRSIIDAVTPQLDLTKRRVPPSRSMGFLGLVLGAGSPDIALSLDLISPAVALALVFLLGTGGFFGAIAAMEWLFPPLELLPDEHSKTRWQRATRIAASVLGFLAGITGIAGFFLALG